MAALQNIRKRGPLIAVVIGLALFAFIVGDMAKAGDSIFGKGKFNVAEINGKALTIQEYEQEVNTTTEYVKLIQNTNTIDTELSNQIRTSVWERLVRNYVLSATVKKLGIGIHSDELYDMVQGTHIDPIVKRNFTNQETGQFDKNYLMQVLQNMDKDPTIKQIWMYMEYEITENRIYTKYINMVQKGMYTTTLETQKDFNERGHIIDFEYVAKNYNTVVDSTIAVTEAELKEYYNSNKGEFEQEESRSIAYVTFDILPSKADSAEIFEEIKSMKIDFEKAEDVDQFVSIKSDFPSNPKYFSPEEFKTNGLDTTLFSSELGFVYGPYLENGLYKLVRLVDVTEISDSASVRHILISPQNPKVATMERAEILADSLLDVINNGGDFDALVTEYTDDPGSKDKGGVYEDFTEGTMVKPFNDFSFKKSVGDIDVVETTYGFHIVEILKQTTPKKKVKVAYVQLSILPSQNTFDDVYALAAKFSGENNTDELFEKAIEEQKLIKKEAPNLTQATSAIPGLQSAREIVRWSFTAELGEVSPAFDLVDRHVIAVLTDSKEKGFATFEQSKEKLEIEVRKDKKAEQFIAEFKGIGSDNLNDYATKFKTKSMKANSVSFNAFQVSGMGYEPSILAMVETMENGKFEGPVKGENGVYVLKATSVTPAMVPEGKTWTEDQSKLTQALRGRASYQAYEALKTLANIKDNRAKFF